MPVDRLPSIDGIGIRRRVRYDLTSLSFQSLIGANIRRFSLNPSGQVPSIPRRSIESVDLYPYPIQSIPES